MYGAALVIAKLDRLSRDAHFLLGLGKGGVDFVAADTKAALTQAKKRGRLLGGSRGVILTEAAQQAGRAVQAARATRRAADLAPIVEELRSAGVTSLIGLATALNERGVPAARGGRWSPVQVRRLLERL